MHPWQARTPLEHFLARQATRQGPEARLRNMSELRAMLAGKAWSFFNNFQARKIDRIKFSCGIGLHFGRHVAAVAVQAQFLAIKPIPQEVVYTLEEQCGSTTDPITGLQTIWE